MNWEEGTREIEFDQYIPFRQDLTLIRQCIENFLKREMLKIWGRPTSACTQKALWGLEETVIDYELTLASGTMGPDGHVSKGGAAFGIVDTPEYRAINPNGTVPTIDDEGFTAVGIKRHRALSLNEIRARRDVRQ